jgi:hypothetical protein
MGEKTTETIRGIMHGNRFLNGRGLNMLFASFGAAVNRTD